MYTKRGAVGSALVALLLAACSDAPTFPTMPNGAGSAFAVGDTPAPTPAAAPGKVVVCNTGNVGGSFDVTRTDIGVGSTGTVSGLNTVIPNGTCYEVANDQGPAYVGSMVTIDEDAADNTVQTVVACSRIDAGVTGACDFADGGSVGINHDHGWVITYQSTYTPPPPPERCTYTKGWYRNSGGSAVTGVDGLTAAQVMAVLSATPGDPGSVTFGNNNALLNLYQQYLAALLNSGTGGPAAVQSAIAVVGAGTDGTGLNITTTLTKAQISANAAVLTSFNEGQYPGYPHCE